MRKLLGILYRMLYWAAINCWGRGASRHNFFSALTVQWRGEFEAHIGAQACIGSRTVISGPAGATLHVGPHAWIGDDCEISVLDCVSIGAHTSLQHRTQVHGDVRIGAGCAGAAGLYISSGWHEFRRIPALPIRLQDRLKAQHGPRSKPVIVGDDCWLGINVVVMPGVEIGRGCVIGANAVVTRDIPPYSIVAGAPARIIGQRLEFAPPNRLDASLDEHLPYFYEGFQVIASDESTSVRREHGGLVTSGPFSLACNIPEGARFRLDVQSPVPLLLRHAEATRHLQAGASTVEYDAVPGPHGRLDFVVTSPGSVISPSLVVRGLNI